ncbi:SGNH/GDSL hydrolase family protein (plasmid) [Croceibacterium sp. TMG7-5b_MA50]|uniref:SGNH/GDSL hydrolase family protein n=1 Tax=Croceibacterium sp. TMG7-5b_MA50 TaxID=3121290 RepID=UPI00322223A6
MRVRIACAALALLAAAPAQAQDGWITGWLSPPIAYEPRIADALGRPFADETVRQEVRASVAGSEVRIRFTNELADEALAIGAASLMQLDAAGAPVPGSAVALRFGGAAGVTIPAGAPFVSDPLPFPLAAGERFAVSVWYPDSAEPPAHAQMLEIVGEGDHTGSTAPRQGDRVRAPGIVSAVEISGAAPTQVLVAFGDSITEGAGATPGRAMDWPAQMARLLAGAGPAGQCWAVANAGISGNRLLHTGRGPNALSRFDRDVLGVAGATHVVILEGINDIGKVRDPARAAEQVTAAQITGAYAQLLARAKAAGLKVIFGTLLPYEGAAYADAAGEQRRQAVNGWLRANAASFDGLIEFEPALGDPANPAAMRAEYQTGDDLHPNDAGYTVMAQTALPVVLAQGCGATPPG